jgi:hypothetical protein
MIVFQIFNKLEICSYLNFLFKFEFAQNLNLFKIKICSNSKSEQILKFKIIQILEKRKKKK